jgi:hypothetical protein
MDEFLHGEADRGLREMDDFLAALSAFDDWCRQNPEQAPIAIEALAQLRRLRESGADAA